MYVFPNPSTWDLIWGQIFKQSLTGLNSEISFS